MTDFTDTIETTAASVEDLQEDLEAHLEDILGAEIEATTTAVETDFERPTELTFYARLDEVEEELEERVGGDVDIGELSLGIRLDGDPE